MTVEGTTVAIRRATTDDSLQGLFDAAVARARAFRGGPELLEQLWGSALNDRGPESLLRTEVDAGHLWVAQRDEVIVAGALVVDHCVRAIWVPPALRRQRIASRLLRSLLDAEAPPNDAWSLPGDRATKSLYESVGWKARLLTMRGE